MSALLSVMLGDQTADLIDTFSAAETFQRRLDQFASALFLRFGAVGRFVGPIDMISGRRPETTLSYGRGEDIDATVMHGEQIRVADPAQRSHAPAAAAHLNCVSLRVLAKLSSILFGNEPV